jgi:DNA-3-methyladenine glycosylase II
MGVDHICSVDSKFRRLVEKHGIIEFTTTQTFFESLVESIISQQLNGAVATSIFTKLKTSLGSETIEPKELHAFSVTKMKRAGVSPQKIRYLKALSARVLSGKLDLDGLRNLPDDEVVRILDEVKGIGPWTAHMFLLFTLGRSDVLPVDDLGIQNSIRFMYSLRKRPNSERIRKIAKEWHPYCSVASLYMWRAVDSE